MNTTKIIATSSVAITASTADLATSDVLFRSTSGNEFRLKAGFGAIFTLGAPGNGLYNSAVKDGRKGVLLVFGGCTGEIGGVTGVTGGVSGALSQ